MLCIVDSPHAQAEQSQTEALLEAAAFHYEATNES